MALNPTITPFDSLEPSDREMWEDRARPFVYPDLRAGYKYHDNMILVLARTLYKLDALSKQGGGQENGGPNQINIWDRDAGTIFYHALMHPQVKMDSGNGLKLEPIPGIYDDKDPVMAQLMSVVNDGSDTDYHRRLAHAAATEILEQRRQVEELGGELTDARSRMSMED